MLAMPETDDAVKPPNKEALDENGRCKNCGQRDKRRWKYCPCCGEERARDRGRLAFVIFMATVLTLGSLVVCVYMNDEWRRYPQPVPEAAPIRRHINELPEIPGSIRGYIIGVAAEHQRASISIGRNDGVRSGMTFIVFNDSGWLADLVTDIVLPESSWGELRFVTQPISPGDRVVDELSFERANPP